MLEKALIYATLANLVIMLAEFAVTHPTVDATKTATMIVRGRYAMLFWGGVVFLGNLLPLMLVALTPIGIAHVIASVLVVAGVYATERIWIEAPQRIPLS